MRAAKTISRVTDADRAFIRSHNQREAHLESIQKDLEVLQIGLNSKWNVSFITGEARYGRRGIDKEWGCLWYAGGYWNYDDYDSALQTYFDDLKKAIQWMKERGKL